MDSFKKYHAGINLIYFIVVIANTFMFMNPVLIGINLFSLLLYGIYLTNLSETMSLWKAAIILVVIALVGNPLFNHQGVTVITYFLERPVTLESIVYGVVSSFFLLSMIVLFHLFQTIMTAEKCTVLFGKVTPKFAMVFSMGLRLIPKLSREYTQIKKVNRGFLKEKRFSIKIISLLIGVSLENSIDTADSMAARGYLIKGRKTHMSDSFSARDVKILILFLLFILLMVLFREDLSVTYFPKVVYEPFSMKNCIYYFVYFGFINIPMILNGKENVRWHRAQSIYFK